MTFKGQASFEFTGFFSIVGNRTTRTAVVRNLILNLGMITQ